MNDQSSDCKPTPLTDSHAGWVVAGQYGPVKTYDLYIQGDGAFVHAKFARDLERKLSVAMDRIAQHEAESACMLQTINNHEFALRSMDVVKAKDNDTIAGLVAACDSLDADLRSLQDR